MISCCIKNFSPKKNYEIKNIKTLSEKSLKKLEFNSSKSLIYLPWRSFCVSFMPLRMAVKGMRSINKVTCQTI